MSTAQAKHPTTLLFKASAGLLLYFSTGIMQLTLADDPNCTGTKASFSATTGQLCLPVVEVPSPSGSLYYTARLQLQASNAALRFALQSAIEINPATEVTARYSADTGLVTIPAVELYERFGTNRYAVSLQLLANEPPSVFELSATISAVISPDYVPDKTWKPYVGLEAYEKSALNILGEAYPYTELAIAVYDFDNQSVGEWDLKETNDLSSGMQAGMYVNRVTNQMVIAYRGTEFCESILCSPSVFLESNRDLAADTLLTQGRDSGQFDDAYHFAQRIITANPGQKIVVTGHSLGGGLAQAVGASFQLETYAFNSSPVPHNFFDDHSVKQIDPIYSQFIHVISDIHDPVSNTDFSGKLYADASHITSPIFFDFDKKVIAPTYKTKLDDFRFNKHTIDTLRDNSAAMLLIYQNGW